MMNTFNRATAADLATFTTLIPRPGVAKQKAERSSASHSTKTHSETARVFKPRNQLSVMWKAFTVLLDVHTCEAADTSNVIDLDSSVFFAARLDK